MNIEFRADIKRIGKRYSPLVNEYKNGTYVKSFDFADAPIFKDLFSAYSYAKKEADELNRRFHNEER